ncbi:four-carbon acid sugar kinase family protein [Kiloniella sp. EL199]|uniref:four-carbon acid sugar kinase family protein n=1 Tax=Kiloniella sp. EL199 TaxID=2107581 RepID=UPI000EA0A3BC|nr:four-carbon acid sugar kinase family protein [Kiloniella sp. EL199]
MKNANSKYPTVVVIADDLTSAADGAGPFLERGLKVTVCRPTSDNYSNALADVISINCRSRSLSETQAACAVRQAMKQVPDCAILFKTVDSTLRGHIKAELEAVYEVSGRKKVVIAPAFPDAGRTTRNGRQFVHDIPVSQSSYANDPVHPAKTALIRDLIPSAIKNVVILDADTQKDLNKQVRAFDRPEEILWIGSPGLAIALAATQFDKKVCNQPIPHRENPLIVVGSANAVSKAQVKNAQKVKSLTCLTTPEERTRNPDAVLSELILKASELAKSGCYGALIATGGDTMEALLDRLHIYEFLLLGEFEPGFPFGVALLENGENIVIAMKAGGFGSENTLTQAVEQLLSSNFELAKVM